MNEKSSVKKAYRPIVGITLGDVNGVGPEVVMKALADTRILQFMIPVVYGHSKVLTHYKKVLNLPDFNFMTLKSGGHLNPKRINVVDCYDDSLELSPGQVTPAGGEAAFAALEKAVTDLKEGVVDALVTAPINKLNIQREDFRFPGHTEYLTQTFEKANSLMFMVSDQMRVGMATGHVSLSKVAERLSKVLILEKLDMMTQSLRKDFGIQKPRIAVLGLNPHAGEDGLLGSEDKEIIEPAIQEYRNAGHLTFGPFPSDGFFGVMMHKKYDAVLAMYHDQGLIPFKMLSFEDGVNFTAGLPIIRTSPDHGTAYGLVGKGMASEGSMRAAIYQALGIWKQRNPDN